MTINVMISYPSEKEREAREIFEYLQELEIDTWFDKHSLVPGDDWDMEISDAIGRAELVIILKSSQTNSKSGVVQRELAKILDLIKDKPIGTNFVLNIRTEKVTLTPEISKYQWLDMFDHDWKSGLIRGILKKFKQLGRKPTFGVEKALAALNASTETQPRSIDLTEENVEYSRSYFVYKEKDEYWHYINSEIVAEMYRSFYQAESRLNNYEQDRPMAWSLNAEEFFRKGDLLSIRFLWFQDAGGAHPGHGSYTLNFVGKNHGRLSLGDLFDFDANIIRHIKDYCELDVKKQLLGIGESIDINFDDFIGDADLWSVFKEFSFNEKGLTLNLSPYAVLAYAFGSFEVLMPWSCFRDKLSENYKSSEIFELV